MRIMIQPYFVLRHHIVLATSSSSFWSFDWDTHLLYRIKRNFLSSRELRHFGQEVSPCALVWDAIEKPPSTRLHQVHR